MRPVAAALASASVALLVSAIMGAIGPAAAQLRGSQTDDASPGYHIKPSDVVIPPGAKPGEIRRITQPFGAWILICDENLKAHTRICNASQSIVDVAGRVIFSWSLAATSGGAPVFILRAPVAGQADRTVLVEVDGRVIPTVLKTCDASLCLGFLAITPDLRKSMTAGRRVIVRLVDRAGAAIVVQTTLDGLAAAVASIR